MNAFAAGGAWARRVLLVLVFSFASPALASACCFGPGSSGFVAYADNANHTMWYSTTDSAKTVVEWARVNDLNPTDMTSTVQATHNGDTDVLVYHSALPAGLAGLTSCSSIVNNICNQFVLKISTTGTPTNVAARHELGHTVGLGHDDAAGYNGCMHSNISGWPPNWTPADVANVNGRY